MFKGVVVVRGRGNHCLREKLLAIIPPYGDASPFGYAAAGRPLELCAACIYGLMRTAAMLSGFERAGKTAKPKPAPKKTRKPRIRQPRPIAPPSDAVEHEDDIPVQSDAELHRAGL